MHREFQSVGLYPDGGSKSYLMNRPSIGKRNFHITTDSLYIQTVIDWIEPVSSGDANSERIYNLLGQPVTEMQPGQIYIRNRRKFIYNP